MVYSNTSIQGLKYSTVLMQKWAAWLVKHEISTWGIKPRHLSLFLSCLDGTTCKIIVNIYLQYIYNIWGIFRVLITFFACVCHLMCHVRSCAPSVMMSWCYVVRWHHMEHWWCHFMMWSWHVIGLAYKRCCTVPIGVHLVLHIRLFTLGTRACLDWCADVPTFLEPTSFKCNWLGCCYYCEHLWCIDTLTHFRNILWVPLHLLHCSVSTGPPYLQLVPVCTIFVVEGLHHQKRIAAGLAPCLPHIAYITILGIPGWAPTEYEWPKSWTSFHLGCNPSLQVWLLERRRWAICSHIWRVSRLDWEGYVYLAGHGHHTHPTMLG